MTDIRELKGIEKMEICQLAVRGIECMATYGQKGLEKAIIEDKISLGKEKGWLLLTKVSIPTVRRFCDDPSFKKKIDFAEKALDIIIEDIEKYQI